MQQRQNLSQRFQEYRPSKTALFWSCAASAVLAIVVGFSWGGWVTGGSATEMAEESSARARQEMAAVVCVDRFMAAPDASVQLAALKEISTSYAQGKFVQDGAWAIVPIGNGAEATTRASSSDHRKAAGLCADELAKREVSATGNVGQSTDETAGQ
jgi:hypothetical protein